MAWYYVDSISVANGASVVSVTGNVDLSQIKAGWMFCTGTTIAEVKSGTASNGLGLSEIVLEKPWEGVTATAQKGLIVPTSGALLEVLKGLEETNAFAIATHKTLSDIATLDADVTIKDAAGNDLTFASMPKNARLIDEAIALADQRVTDKNNELDSYVTVLKSEYIRGSYYLPLPEKIVVSGLGLSDEQVANYEYSDVSDYSPVRDDGQICFVDIAEFSNGFSHLAVPSGMSVYLNFLVNVSGHTDALQTTLAHLLVEKKGTSGLYTHDVPTSPHIYLNDGQKVFDFVGRNWLDNYNDRNVFKINNYAISNNAGQGALRIINLGVNALEIFGIGYEVRY